jgi:hypothetical protein
MIAVQRNGDTAVGWAKASSAQRSRQQIGRDKVESRNHFINEIWANEFYFYPSVSPHSA